jgi:hypothetical protein
VTSTDPKLGPLVRNIVVHPPEPNYEAIAARQRIAQYESQAREADEAANNPPGDVSDRAGFIKQKQEEAAAARADAEQARTLEAGKRVNLVTYKKWMQDSKTKKNVLVDKQFIAEIPFTPPGVRGTQVDPSMTVMTYLDELKKRTDFIRYSSGWWTTKPMSTALWTGGAVVVIGVFWPTVLGAMVGAGLGRKHEPKPKAPPRAYYSGPEPAKPARPAVTADDQRRLQEMTEKLEHGLAGAGVGMSQASTDQAAAAAAAVRKLDGGPLEVAPALSNPDADDEIEIKGEYYPVLIHHKKHHDEAESHPEQKKT